MQKRIIVLLMLIMTGCLVGCGRDKAPEVSSVSIDKDGGILHQIVRGFEENYDMDRLWNKGGKAWTYEYKYWRGGKTLCALYARENCVGFMIIFGKEERLKFEKERESYAKEIQRVYEEAKTYHDGKWMMFEPTDTSLLDDFMRLLRIKRRPNKK